MRKEENEKERRLADGQALGALVPKQLALSQVTLIPGARIIRVRYQSRRSQNSPIRGIAVRRLERFSKTPHDTMTPGQSVRGIGRNGPGAWCQCGQTGQNPGL